MISVIIPTYNREKTVLKAINSILKQNFDNYEIIIVDDGSTDKTKDIISNLKNEKIKYFYINNSGPGKAKYYGVEKSQYKYILFLDSDDELYDSFTLEKIYKEIERGNEFICFNKIIKIFPNKRIIENSKKIRDMKRYILTYPLNYPGKPPYIIKKELYIESGGLNIKEKWGEGILFWRKLFLKISKYKVINDVGYIYHLEGNDNVSKGKVDKRSKKIDLIYNSIYNSYRCLYDELNKTDKLNWELTLLGISIIRKKNRKYFMKKIITSNKLLIIKSLIYILKRRIER